MESAATIVIATSSRGKLAEVRLALGELPLCLLDLTRFVHIPAPDEDATTFEGNARLKALYYAERTRYWCLADDSGLEVDALGGLPGVRSARFAGPVRDDAANNAELVRRLAGVRAERRTARFRCVLALARPGDVVECVEGSVEGQIIAEPRGSNGFGYDPHFLIPDLGRTAAQLTPEEKNRISHRGKALAELVPRLGERLGEM